MKRRQMAETLLSALFFFSACSGLFVVHTAFANEADEEVLYLADVRFENLDSDFLNEKKARKTVRLTPGQRLSPEIGNQAAWRLMEAYRIRYHYQPVVRWSAVSADRAGFADLVFSVEAGPRGKVATVYFSGNKALRSSVLRAGLGVLPQTGFWARTLGRDVFRIETLEQDRKTILRTYQEQGFTRAEVGAPVIHPAGPGRLRIEWPIRMEGPQFRVGKLDIQSDIPFPRARGLSALSLRLGARFDILRMEESAASLTGLLRENGYPFAEVKAQAELDDARGLAYIVWAIQAGQPATVRSVLIRGNTRTSDLVLRREIELKAGDCYRESAAAASRANLLALGLFEEVRVAAVGQKEAAACEIEVDVKERPTGTVQIGLQYDSEERGAIVLELRERNFSFRPPYRGDGIDLFFSSQWGETRSRVSLNGTLPRLGYSPYLLNSGIHFDDAEYEENYSQRSYGLTVRTGRAVGRHDRI
ncbi:MAG: POTRA domain-containing protein, partial [Kiritimatiellia bacterium]|nr:POTRA domain-containing protein [Kiritimatiellia bacterium]